MQSKTLVAVLAAIIAFTGLAACSKTTVVPDVQNVVVAPAALPVDTSSAEDTPAACPDPYVQTVTPDPILNRFIEGGLKGLPGDMNAQVLAALGHSSPYMKVIGETLLKAAIDQEALVNESATCLSDNGQTLMTKLEGAFAMLTASDTTVTTGYNTGISGGQVVVDTSGVINGDTSAIKFVDRNGNVVLILLRRCGNVVLPSPGNFPAGKTDNPPPPPQGNPPPPPQGNPPPPSNAKNAKDSVNAVQGTTPLAQTKPVTNGKASSDQKSTGATYGNVTDNKVPAGTGSGTTTTDLGSASGTAAGASPGGDSAAGTSSGTGQTSTGGANGTGGAVVITNPNG